MIGSAASQRQNGNDKLYLVFGPVASSSVYDYSEARLFVMYKDWHSAGWHKVGDPGIRDPR